MLIAGEPIRTANRALRSAADYVAQVAPTRFAVLIEGETGTGKEVWARAIHEQSRRAGPFIAINCSAIPEPMFEAELFGARRGAYTGLDTDRAGLLRAADRGTLFLDEVADLPLPVQAKLLRVLEDGEVRPLGGTTSFTVDVRIISATNSSLEPRVQQGPFSHDLYFRLSTAAVKLPPLRERVDDIPGLVDEILTEIGDAWTEPTPRISPDAMLLLVRYSWPGNIRQLKHVVASAVLAARGDLIR